VEQSTFFNLGYLLVNISKKSFSVSFSFSVNWTRRAAVQGALEKRTKEYVCKKVQLGFELKSTSFDKR
jgi:hypothetical protein